jgi:hypothetical protein
MVILVLWFGCIVNAPSMVKQTRTKIGSEFPGFGLGVGFEGVRAAHDDLGGVKAGLGIDGVEAV